MNLSTRRWLLWPSSGEVASGRSTVAGSVSRGKLPQLRYLRDTGAIRPATYTAYCSVYTCVR